MEADSRRFPTGAIVTQREPNTFSCAIDRDGAIKMSFLGFPAPPRLLPPLIAPDNGLQIASLLDLAATKSAVVTDDHLREALDHAPPGIIDPRSWASWNSKPGRCPAPPMPRRRLG